MRIPLYRANYTDASLRYVNECLGSRRLRGDGPFTARCHDWLEERLGGAVFLTTSCTTALEMAALLLELQPGDEVVCPSFTFVSTPNAFLSRGARPVFADIREDTLNLDEGRLAGALSPKTRAIAVVHYAGVGCEMDEIVRIAADAGAMVIEDAAHGFGSRHRARPLGTMGDFGCYSFHETKGVSCGEGGALVVNRPAYRQRAEILWEKGTDRRAFARGEVAQYTWKDVGSSFLPSDLVAACLLGQLEESNRAGTRRWELCEEYRRQLSPLVAAGHVALAVVPEHCRVTPDLFHILLPTRLIRDDLMAYLNRRGIGATFHYLPLHLSAVGRRLGYREGDFPVTEAVSGRLLRLPFFYGLLLEDVTEVVDQIRQFFCAGR